jgi:hypothetical protein
MPNAPQSRASAFFEQITKEPTDAARAAFLENLVTKKFSESEYVDYKAWLKLTPHSDEVKRKWSKGLSCFANSDGGVIIWGIDAPKNIPDKLALVTDVHALKTRLLELQPGMTEPVVRGVEVLAVPRPPSVTEGFVVCLIPPSPWRPHEAKHPRDYFIRSGDNCIPVGPSMLRALFQPTEVATLSIFARAFGVQQAHPQVSCWLHNAGPSTAYDVFVIYETPNHIYVPSVDRRMWEVTSTGFSGIAVIATRPIHPTEVVGIFTADLRPTGPCENAITFKLFAKHQDPVTYRVTISQARLESSERFGADLVQ